ncbi:virulence associated protein C [Dissulfuribacter thermophilus]|uniref:Virulence associated protein C n=1 Tax=Dissulfuribacter thermophilus TaxID=1156395 RepID=A0A1B9F7U6_9BACT|nr:type II toxin-antitoxin system VapC family toxin [Dissulfuribacter thermophilus]OCC15970.1 virulence associated protein C [Dissulfuribacter thermophilus]
MRRLLIDTNIYSCALRGHDEVVEILRRAELIGFSVVSIGELLTGFKLGKWESKNRNELEEFLDSPRVTIYGIDENTSEFYSEIVWNLRKIGRPIPTNDIWIAATAFQHGLKLFSKDEHFKYIAGLPLV